MTGVTLFLVFILAYFMHKKIEKQVSDVMKQKLFAVVAMMREKKTDRGHQATPRQGLSKSDSV